MGCCASSVKPAMKSSSTASISPDVNDPGARNTSFDELRAAYFEQATKRGLSGVL